MGFMKMPEFPLGQFRHITSNHDDLDSTLRYNRFVMYPKMRTPKFCGLAIPVAISISG